MIKSTAVKDLSPLAAMPLKYLNIRQTNVKDLTPIQNSTIEEIYLDYNPFEHRKGTHDAFISVLQRMPCLRLVNGQSL